MDAEHTCKLNIQRPCSNIFTVCSHHDILWHLFWSHIQFHNNPLGQPAQCFQYWLVLCSGVHGEAKREEDNTILSPVHEISQLLWQRCLLALLQVCTQDVNKSRRVWTGVIEHRILEWEDAMSIT